VRIVIPMITNPPAQPAPPVQYAPPVNRQPPAYNAPPTYQPPPAYSAPPAYQPPPAYSAPPAYQPPPQQPVLPIKVIPALPNPYSATLYRVQVGAFGSAGLAQQCFSRLLSAGFSPAYEPYGNVNRVVLPGIRAADMHQVAQRLAAAGFSEIWIREEN